MKQQQKNTFDMQAASFGGVIYLIVAPLLLLFYWLIVDPRLIYHTQQPVFFYDWSFIKGYFASPGGPIKLLSNFITQFYTNASLGALLLTAAILLSAFAVRRLTNLFGKTVAFNTEWLVIAPLIALPTDYRYPVQYTLALILFFFTFFVYFKLTARMNQLGKTIGFLIIAFILYYLAGAIALALPLLFVLSLKSRTAMDMLMIMVTILIVVAVPQLLYQLLSTDPSKLYSCALPLILSFKQKLLYAGVLLLFAVLMTIPTAKKMRRNSRLSLLFPAVSILITAAAIYLTFQPQYPIVLRADAMAEQRHWQPLLQLLKDHPNINHRLTNLQRFRALYFTGQLGERLFEFSGEGADGLYCSDKRSYDFPLVYCDLLTDLGNVNGALHKVYEAWALEGETPRVLQRLGYLHLAKNEFSAAEKYLLKLEQTGKKRDWVKIHLSLCRNQSLGGSNDLLRLNQFVEQADFLMRPGFPHAELKEIVGVQPSRMAVEYLLSYELLTGRLDSFMADLPLFLHITPDLPRAFEEAVVLYLNSGLPVSEAQRAIAVRRSTVDSFMRFMEILQKYGNDKRRAFGELQQNFGDSFWFHFLYSSKGQAQ